MDICKQSAAERRARCCDQFRSAWVLRHLETMVMAGTETTHNTERHGHWHDFQEEQIKSHSRFSEHFYTQRLYRYNSSATVIYPLPADRVQQNCWNWIYKYLGKSHVWNPDLRLSLENCSGLQFKANLVETKKNKKKMGGRLPCWAHIHETKDPSAGAAHGRVRIKWFETIQAYIWELWWVLISSACVHEMYWCWSSCWFLDFSSPDERSFATNRLILGAQQQQGLAINAFCMLF